MYCPTVEYIRPSGHPFRTIDLTAQPSTPILYELPCNLPHKAYSPGRRVLCISKRPKPVNIVHCSSCIRHEPFSYSQRHRPTPKNTLSGNPGCAVGPKTPTTGAPGRGVCRRSKLAQWPSPSTARSPSAPDLCFALEQSHP
jgi:hypothetical protein